MPRQYIRPTCTIPDCNNPNFGHGFCSLHYTRWRRKGDPLAAIPFILSPKGSALAERFWLRVDTEGKWMRPEIGRCWAWKGSTSCGYGHLPLAGKQHTRAHRASWELHFGPIPDGLFVCHKCDNRPCSRPDHLFLGSHADNMADMVSKGRQGRESELRARGESHYRHRLTDGEVLEIRMRCGESHRALAREFGVGKTTIDHILRGDTWKHLYGPPERYALVIGGVARE